MDLHALAAQLSKLKLSQRLFVEEDLLPEELVCMIINLVGLLLSILVPSLNFVYILHSASVFKLFICNLTSLGWWCM